MIPVWGGACETQLKKVQTLLNNTARFVHRRGRRSNVRKLMEDSKWMTVKEMARFHSLVTLWKIRKYGVPQQLANLYTEGDDGTLETPRPRLQTARNSFKWRSACWWRETPQQIREIGTLNSFKKSLRKWVIGTRPVLGGNDMGTQQATGQGLRQQQDMGGQHDATRPPDTDAVRPGM